MENVTLTRDELDRLLKAFATVVFGLGLITVGFLTDWFSKDILTSFGRASGIALTGAGVLLYVFCEWTWRLGWVARAMKKPLVFGVWIGVLESDYGKQAAPISLPIVFVIRQNFLSIHITSYTQTQEGASRVEALIRNSRAETTVLAYVFELTQVYAGATTRTTGTGELKLQGNGNELNGNYWTNSPTHGTLRLRLVSREIDGITKFADAAKRWPADISRKKAPQSTSTAV